MDEKMLTYDSSALLATEHIMKTDTLYAYQK
jgi:hypothetical protein